MRQPEIRPVRKFNRFLARKLTPKPIVLTQRLDCQFIPHIVRFNFEFSLDPSAHEQLEARLLLRDWMSENLSLEQYAHFRRFFET